MRVGILSYGFSQWGGGIDFIRNMLSYLDEGESSDPELIKILFLPSERIIGRFKKLIHPFRILIAQFLRRDRLAWVTAPGFSTTHLKLAFGDFSASSDIVFSGSTFKSQLGLAVKLKIDIVFPCMDVPPDDFGVPWIGYLYDFQHRYFPEFFDKKEIEGRNQFFQKMLYQAKHIIVNGQAVIEDANLFYPGHTAKLHALPFSPFPQAHWLSNTLVDVRSKYDISSLYFLISNQFWRHKDHATAFRALAEYYASGGQALLVCTGDTHDWRFPYYFPELMQLIKELHLEDKIKILGHISKDEQISLMKNSIAVIQPTLFEGGPGGGCTYDAISLGVPVIASDIPINREINCGDVVFFPAGDFQSLTKLMLARELTPFESHSSNALLIKGLERKRLAGQALENIFTETLDSFKS